MEKMWLQRFAEGTAEGTAAEGGGAAAAAEGTDGLVEQQAEEVQAQPEQPEDSLTREHWQQVERIYQGWRSEAEALKQLFPDFDIRRELEDERFAGMLLAGVDMGSAYQALHADQILPAAMEYAARRVEAGIAASLGTGGRPGENGLGGGGAVLVGRNVTHMSRQDYAKVCRMVERGERVSFG